MWELNEKWGIIIIFWFGVLVKKNDGFINRVRGISKMIVCLEFSEFKVYISFYLRRKKEEEVLCLLDVGICKVKI